MTVLGERRRARPKPKVDEVAELKRLIAIQTQIVELAKQNELAEKECAELRQELSRSARRPARRWSPMQLMRALVQKFFKRAS
jgi:hypothetical protein